MNELAEIYISNIQNYSYNLENKITQLEICSISQFNSIMTEVQKLLKDIESNLKNLQIEITVNSNDFNNNSKYNTNLKEFNLKLIKYKAKINKLKDKNKKNLELEVNLSKINSDYTKINNEEIAYNSFNKLQKATRTSLEMENMTGNILGDLNIQSDKMKNVTVKLGDMNEDLNKSSSLLNGMLKRTKRNKMKILFFAIFLIILFLFVLFWKLFIQGNFNNNKTPSNNNNNNINNTSPINETIKI